MSVFMPETTISDVAVTGEPVGNNDIMHAWKPGKPGPTERVLRKMSRWSGIAVPFMVQNIGWFVSGFLLVAGSVFVVACTKGFVGNLVTAIFLFCYTLLLIAGAWHVKRRRPELRTVTRVLVTVAMLLMPLSIAASARIIEMQSLPALIAGILLAAINLLIFFPASRLATGIIDRDFEGLLSKLFVSLAAIQLAAPIVGHVSKWPILAAAHVAILGLTTYGFTRFLKGWLKSVFVEERNIAHYGAGLVLFAASVSFAHLTWRFDSMLPDGYFGPFLMFLSGLLFSVDAKIKKMATHNLLLTCFSFAVYGMSAVSMAVCFDAPVARIVTLVLGAGVYAGVMRRYLTPAPLYMLVGCLGWLYGLLILPGVPWPAYLMAGIPGLAGLFLIHKWIAKRNAQKLATVCFRILTILFTALAVWSLIHAGPGLFGTGTCLLIVGAVYYFLRYSFPLVFSGLGLSPATVVKITGGETDLRNTPWFYFLPLVSISVLAYAPVFFGNGLMQFAIGLTILAVAWLWEGTAYFRQSDGKGAIRTSVLYNCAFLAALSALFVTVTAKPHWDALSLHMVLVLSGGVVTWLGLTFRLRALVCCGIALAVVALKLIRRTWFPGMPMGVSTMLAAVAAWAALWRISGNKTPAFSRFERLASVLPKIPAPSFTLVWLARAETRSVAETVRSPLEFALPLLWAWSLFRLGNHAAIFGPTIGWTCAVAFAAAITSLFVVSFRLATLSPIPLAISLGAWMGAFCNAGITDTGSLGCVAVLWSMSVWVAMKWAQSKPIFSRFATLVRFKEGALQPGLVERRTRQTTYVIAILAMIAAVGGWCVTHSLTTTLTLPVGMVFFGLTGRYYKKRFNSYAVLAAASVSGLMVFAQVMSFSNSEIMFSERTGLFLAMSGLFAWGLAHMADHFGKTEKTDFHDSLWRKPLRVSAVWLVLSGALQLAGLIVVHGSGTGYLNGNVVFPGLLMAATGLLLGNHQLRNRVLVPLGIFLAAISVFWIEGFLLCGELFTLLPTLGNQWLTLALIGFLLAGLATQSEKSANESPYATPLRGVALLAWACVLMKTIPALISAAHGTVVASCTPWLFAIQALTLFPLSQAFRNPPEIRGLGLAALLTGFVMTVLPSTGFFDWMPFVRIGWAFAILGLSDVALPAFNTHAPKWRVSSKTWPGFGLVLLAMPFTLIQLKTVFLQWHHWMLLSVYLCLMLRTGTQRILYWLAAGALSCAAILSAAKVCVVLRVCGAGEMATGALVWTAFLPFLIPVANKYGAALAEQKAWKAFDPSEPFLSSGVALLLVSHVLAVFLPEESNSLPDPSLFFGAGLLSLCFFHLFRSRNHLAYANGLILSVLFGTATAWLHVSADLAHLPFVMALFCGALFVTCEFWDRKQWTRENTTAMRRALAAWTMLCPWPTLLSLVVVPMASFVETLAALAILTGIVAALGFRRENSGLIFASRILGLILLHIWPFSFLPSGKTEGLVLWQIWPVLCAQFERLQTLFPWYALQMAILVWGVIGIRRRVSDAPKGKPHPITAMFHTLTLEITLALAAWTLHFITFVGHVGTETTVWIHGAELSAAFLLILLGTRKAVSAKQSAWVYGTAFFTGLALVYLRLALLGLAQPGIWDAATIVAVACGLSVAHRFAQNAHVSVPLYTMAVLLPIPAIFFMPLQFASSAPAALLLVIGALWLSMRHATGKSLPLYLGVLAINGAIYLWVPAWANRYDLLQLYTVPAALTMLVLLHLHRNEIKRGVLNNTRLAAICMLYASAGLDMFLRPEFWIFGLAFALALCGILLGTALRIRAFLFGGVAFLVMNVLGQMIRFYPEHGLNKGILLMTSGAVMMSGMIWFNVKKESILKRVRVFRSDLENWG